jgi:pimeloyl-ACP methyl ester carboxylesterase
MRLVFFLVLFLNMPVLQASDTTCAIKRVYLVPGQGSDGRIFKNIEITGKEMVILEWVLPEKNETMNSLARRMAEKIDTTQPFAIVGVSLGGMIACEMSTFLSPQKVIIISSASGREEIPRRYRFMKYLPVYKIIPAGWIKAGAKIAQPLVEPDRNKEKETCKAMLRAKDKRFLKRTIHCIVNWDPPPQDSTKKIIHIHGTSDHTLPARRVRADFLIDRGSHMMTLTRGEEISALLDKLLCD